MDIIFFCFLSAKRLCSLSCSFFFDQESKPFHFLSSFHPSPRLQFRVTDHKKQHILNWGDLLRKMSIGEWTRIKKQEWLHDKTLTEGGGEGKKEEINNEEEEEVKEEDEND